ncbi:hypothetical protein [Microcystis aeruginosa]
MNTNQLEISQKNQEKQEKIMTTELIDLQEIAQKLVNNPTIIESAKKQKTLIKASNICNKIPSLKSLGDLPLISIAMNKQGNLQALIICLYRDGQKAVFCLPDLNATVTDLLFLESFKTGKQGYAIASNRDKSIRLKTAISNSLEHLAELEFEDKLGIEGIAKKFDISWLKERPILEIPLKSLEKNIVYSITRIGHFSKQFKTPLIDVKDESGNEFFNIITNSFLARYSDEIGKKFKITSIVEENQKVKGKTQKITKVNVLPLNGLDFSEF